MSDLVGNPEDRFSHNEAHILCIFQTASISEGFSNEEYIQYQKLQLVTIKEEPPVSDNTMSSAVKSPSQVASK